MTNQRIPTLGVALALAAALLFGLNASTTKVIIQSGMTAEQVVFIRSMFSAVIALIWALLANRSALRIERRMIPRLLLLGVVGVGGLQWTYSLAVVMLPVGIALLIEYTAVLWVPLILMLFFNESIKRQIWLGAALVLGGLAIVGQVWDSSLDPVGVFWAFAAAGSLTVYFILGQRVQLTLPTNVTMFYGMSISAVLFFFASDWGSFDFGRLAESQNLMGNLSGYDLPLWVALIWLGIFGSFLPMAFSYLALRHLSATIVGIIATSETVLAFFFALLWLNEVITMVQALGGIVVVIGILIAQTARKQSEAKAVD